MSDLSLPLALTSSGLPLCGSQQRQRLRPAEPEVFPVQPFPEESANQSLVLAVAVQSLSRVRLFETPWPAACQASQTFTISQSLLKLMSIESVMPSSHLILCRPLILLPQSLPASGSFPMGQLFASGGPSTGVSASTSLLPMNTQD